MADIHEIRVMDFEESPEELDIAHDARRLLGVEDLEIEVAQVYRFEGITAEEAERLAKQVYDPITQHIVHGPRIDWDDAHIVEVSPKPGTTVPEEENLIRVANIHGIEPVAVSSSKQYEFAAGTRPSNRERIVGELLMNETIQFVRKEAPKTLIEKREAKGIQEVPIRDLDDDGLKELSDERGLALSVPFMKAIQNHFKGLEREPTDVEMEFYGGAWSDHCNHITWTNDVILPDGTRKPPMYTRVKTASKEYFGETGVRSAFGDNSGAIDFFNDKVLTIKAETHISPSGKEPFGGAQTGVGGEERDMKYTGTGWIRQIGGGDNLIFASPKVDLQKLPEGMLPPPWIAKQVVAGIADYNNKTGIPNVHGSVHFLHDTNSFEFTAKPMVLVTGIGYGEAESIEKGKPKHGDIIVLVGGRTGRDGIHGATASSEEANADEKAAFASFVQVGNPITQKTMFDFTDEAARRGLYNAANDLGASGISSGGGEMAEEIGATFQLANVPTKYSGLEAWEKWISEAQERAILAVSPEKFAELQELAELYGTEITIIGTFGNIVDGEPRLVVYDGDELAIDQGYNFIKNGMPKIDLIADWKAPEIEEIIPSSSITSETLMKILAHGSICSKEPVTRQYDQTVQAGTSLPSYGGIHHDAPNDAAVMMPELTRKEAAIMASGLNPNLIKLNPRNGTLWACTESVANLVAVGGDPEAIAFCENFMWPSPDPQNVGSQDIAVDAVVEFIHAFRRSVVSGKDSQSSRFKSKEGEIIDNPPVVAWTTVGKIEDVDKTTSTDIKKAGSTLVLVGEQDLEAMGGSAYFDIEGGSSLKVPSVNLGQLPKTFKAVHNAIKEGKVLSAHDVSEGGVAVAVAEMCFGGEVGASLSMPASNQYELAGKLFNETPGCFVLEIDRSIDVEELFSGIPHKSIGYTTDDKIFEVINGEQDVIIENIDALKRAWKKPMQEFYA